MATKSYIEWDSKELNVNLAKLGQKVDRALAAIVERQATKSENYMKRNAPWTDDTTNARQGLRTYPFHAASSHGYYLAHGVPYGIWLEVRWHGRYAIIPQATIEGGMMVMSLMTKLLARLDQ